MHMEPATHPIHARRSCSETPASRGRPRRAYPIRTRCLKFRIQAHTHLNAQRAQEEETPHVWGAPMRFVRRNAIRDR
jgi:hypothetical protein